MIYLKKCIFLILFICTLNSCLLEENLNLPYKGYTPDAINDDWSLSTPEAEGFDADKIADIYNRIYSGDLYPNLHSLLIVRNGKLLAEAYTKDKKEQDMFHNLVSATKSITSVLTGIAIDKGYITSVNTPVFEIIPEYFDDDPQKRGITIHHVLTMETGLDFDDDIHTNEMYNYKGSSLEFVLHKKLIFQPGTDWYYGDGNPQIISGIIKKLTGKTEEDFAEEYLFSPLAITKYYWESHSDGLTYGAKGLWLRPRDMAKIGQLMVQQGSWNNQQIVSAEWLNTSTKLQSTHQNYGYYWYPLPDYNGFYAEGHGGQIIWIAPEEQLVIVITSDSYSKTFLLSESYNTVITDIVNAISD